MDSGTGMGYFTTTREGNIVVTGKTARCMAKVPSTTPMAELPTKGSGSTTHSTAREYFTTKIPKNNTKSSISATLMNQKTSGFTTKAISKMMTKMAPVFFTLAMVRNLKGNSNRILYAAKVNSSRWMVRLS